MKFFRSIKIFTKEIIDNKSAIIQLTKRDFQNRYIGSSLGFLWSIIQPIANIVILWLVFTKGFKAGPINNVPFIVYLSLGIISWEFFSQSLLGSTSVFQEYSYLVKKISFKIAILPIIKILSSAITHMIFITICIIILFYNNISFSFIWFQTIYFMSAVMILTLGLGWITSSLQVFFKDIAQLITILLQIGFWTTPVVWNFEIVPPHLQFIFKLNPMYYIITGYRDSFVNQLPFWHDKLSMIYFWTVTLFILLIGVLIFKKLRPHFADVL